MRKEVSVVIKALWVESKFEVTAGLAAGSAMGMIKFRQGRSSLLEQKEQKASSSTSYASDTVSQGGFEPRSRHFVAVLLLNHISP